MSNRFVNNVTPLDADTLNQFEDDLKASAMPVYNAVYEGTVSGYKTYRISDVEWNTIPVGSLFSVIFNQTTQGTTNEIVAIRFGASNTTTYNIYYGTPDYSLTLANTPYVRVGSRSYLYANRAYVMKKNVGESSTQFITIMDHFETAKFGATLDASSGSIQMKNLDGTAVSSVTLPTAAQNTRGGVKIWTSGSTLNISNT